MARQEDAALTLVVLLIAVIFIILILVPVLAMTLGHGGGMMGMGGMMGSDTGAFGLSLGSVLAIIGVVLIAVILLATLLRSGPREVVYVPQPVGVAPQTPAQGVYGPPPAAPAAEAEPAPPEDFERWALRLLEGDERRLFREIVDKGGVAYQKDLGVRSDFSRAKVTRLLDKLEDKGLVVKERAGMTNRVRVVEPDRAD